MNPSSKRFGLRFSVPFLIVAIALLLGWLGFARSGSDDGKRSLPSADLPQIEKQSDPVVEIVPVASPEPPRTKNVTFDDIKLEMKKGDAYDPSLLTDKVKQLDGMPIRIRGFIHPSICLRTGITHFVLVRDDQECCFGPGALLHDCIIVDMTPPATADFTMRPVKAEGVFSTREVKFNDTVLAIYHLDCKQVQ